jgi:hypothetical protein
MEYIPLFKPVSTKEIVLVYAMLIASFGISCLSTFKIYSFFNKFPRSRRISNRRNKW